MKKLREIMLLLVLLTSIQFSIASENEDISYIENSIIFNEGYEVEQLLNSNSQVNIGFIDKIADWIAGWFPNWNFWQKTVGTGAGHYIEKDGTEITYPMTLYDRTIYNDYNGFRNDMMLKMGDPYFKRIYQRIYENAIATPTMTCSKELNRVCDVATKAKLVLNCISYLYYL